MALITTQVVSTSTITAAGNTSSAVVQPVGNVGGPVYVAIGVTAVTGSGASLSPVVQFSADNSTWLTANTDETFPAITATGATVLRVGQSRGQYVRVSWPLPAGTSPNITAAIVIWS